MSHEPCISHGLYFRRVGAWAVRVGITGLAITLVGYFAPFVPFVDIGWWSMLACPALTFGVAMMAAPGKERVQAGVRFEDHWVRTPWTNRLVWLVGLLVGTALYLVALMVFIVATDGDPLLLPLQ